MATGLLKFLYGGVMGDLAFEVQPCTRPGPEIGSGCVYNYLLK
jgi:hypothetical protein